MPTAGLVDTTPPGSKQVSSVTWAVYRDVQSLDPMFAFDYPENTAISLMCESLLLLSPEELVSAVACPPACQWSPGPTTTLRSFRVAAAHEQRFAWLDTPARRPPL